MFLQAITTPFLPHHGEGLHGKSLLLAHLIPLPYTPLYPQSEPHLTQSPLSHCPAAVLHVGQPLPEGVASRPGAGETKTTTLTDRPGTSSSGTDRGGVNLTHSILNLKMLLKY